MFDRKLKERLNIEQKAWQAVTISVQQNERDMPANEMADGGVRSIYYALTNMTIQSAFRSTYTKEDIDWVRKVYLRCKLIMVREEHLGRPLAAPSTIEDFEQYHLQKMILGNKDGYSYSDWGVGGKFYREEV